MDAYVRKYLLGSRTIIFCIFRHFIIAFKIVYSKEFIQNILFINVTNSRIKCVLNITTIIIPN